MRKIMIREKLKRLRRNTIIPSQTTMRFLSKLKQRSLWKKMKCLGIENTGVSGLQEPLVVEIRAKKEEGVEEVVEEVEGVEEVVGVVIKISQTLAIEWVIREKDTIKRNSKKNGMPVDRSFDFQIIDI